MKLGIVPLLAVVAVAAAVVVGILATGAVFRAPAAGGALVSCGGLSVLGTPSVTTITNPENGAERRLLKLDVAANCPGTFVRGTLGSAFLRQATGFDFGEGFTLTASASEQSLVYPIVNDRITLAEYSQVGDVGIPQCGAVPVGTWIKVVEWCSIYGYPNWWRRDVGAKGHLAPIPRTEFFTDLTIALDSGQLVTKKISSIDTRVEWTRDNATLATATWQGNLVTGEAPPDATGVVAVFSTARGTWNLATLAEWDAYRFQFVSEVKGAGGATLASFTVPNTGPGPLFASVASLPVPGKFAADGSGYIITAAPRIQTPVISLLIDGDFLGIATPSGIPGLSFTGTDPAKINAGNPGSLIFSAANLGNISAGFDLAVTCNGAPVGVAQRLTLAPKTPQEVRVPWTPALPGSQSCVGVLTDIVSGAIAKQARTTFVLAVQVCQPGLTIPTGQPVSASGVTNYFGVPTSTSGSPGALLRCAADGSGWSVVLDCTALQLKSETQCVSVSLGCVAVTGQQCPPEVVTSDPTASQGGVCNVTVDYKATPSFRNGEWACIGSPQITGARASKLNLTARPTPTPFTPAIQPGQAQTAAAPQPTPGFEAASAIVGLVVAAAILWRQRRNG